MLEYVRTSTEMGESRWMYWDILEYATFICITPDGAHEKLTLGSGERKTFPEEIKVEVLSPTFNFSDFLKSISSSA